VSAQLNMMNTYIRELVEVLDGVKKGKNKRDDALRILDDIENQIDVLLSQLSPERITDERFSAAVKALSEIAEKFKSLRESIILGRYALAKSQAIDVQESIRHVYRLLTLIRAGAPTPLIFQVTPQFLRETVVPEALIYASPMAAQIYNIVLRKGEVAVDELALELKIDDKTRDEFNRAVSQLLSTGYVRAYFTSDNKIILRPSR